MVALSGRDTWIGAFFSVVFGTLWLFFLVLKTDNNKFKEVIKTPTGKIIGILLLLFFTETAILMIYDFLTFFSLIILPKTPEVTFTIILIVLCIYSISKGYENLEAIAFLLVIPCLILMIFGLSSGLIKLKIENLLPILENGIKPSIRGAIYQFSNIGHLLILYLLPVNFNSKKRKFGVILAMATIYIIISLLSSELIRIFGLTQTSRLTYKLYAIFQIMNIQTFLSHYGLVPTL